MVITHSDADHPGGALAVMQAAKVDWVVSSLWSTHPIVRAARANTRCVAGQRWSRDGVEFEMPHPTLASYDNPALKPNTRGFTQHIRDGGHSILLAADIEAAQEAQLVLGSVHKLPGDVLLAPQYVSGTSSTPGFPEAVHPALGVFQVGYRNRCHHSKAEVYERYREMGIGRLRTDESGAILLHFGAQVQATSYRSEHQRYWYGR